MSTTIKIKRGLSANLTSVNLEQGEPAFTTDTKKYYIGNASGEKVLINPDITKETVNLENVDNIQQASKIEFEAEKLAVRAEISLVETIAKGASRAIVFSTYQQLTDWLSGTYIRPDNKTIADLQTGDNLFIIDRDVPDYWWDGAQIQELETQKVDLTDYPKTTEVQAMLAAEVIALQAQLLLMAPIANANLTGVPTAPTAVPTTNDNQIATTAFVKSLGYLDANSVIDGGTF